VKTSYRYGIVLVLLLATFMFLVAGFTGAWASTLLVALQGATLLAALSASQVRARLRRMATFVTLFCVVASIVTIPMEGRAAQVASALLAGLLVVLAPVAIVTSILRRRVIDVRTVLGALCIYVLLGLVWAFIYTAIGNIGTRPFFAQQQHATSSEFVYFSFVTLTTVGYGDLTAAGNAGRGFAVLEALIGQIYLVTIVALLVSNLGAKRESRSDVGS
jgi:hypothetical protein